MWNVSWTNRSKLYTLIVPVNVATTVVGLPTTTGAKRDMWDMTDQNVYCNRDYGDG